MLKAANKAEKELIKELEPKFTKQQLLHSERYADKTDILSALLEEGKNYSRKEAEQTITDFMKGKVN